MGDPLDELAKLRAAFDQVRESAKEVAGLVASYHQTLLSAGTEPEHAVTITVGYQAFLLSFLFGVFGPVQQADAEE